MATCKEQELEVSPPAKKQRIKQMEEPVFKLPRVGLVGGRPVDRTYMDAIEKRAKRLEDACRVVKVRSKESIPGNKRQMEFQFCGKQKERFTSKGGEGIC